MRRGFILIEVMIATVIASIISVMLLTMVSQMNRVYARLDSWTHLYFRAMTVQNLLERDLMGAFIYKTPEAKKDDEKEDQHDLFHGHDNSGEFEFVSCITTSTLISYWLPKGKLVPRMVRVVYWLIPEKGDKKSFRLVRQQTQDLKMPIKELRVKQEENKDIVAVARGIKECQIKYVWQALPPEKDKNQDKEPRKERMFRRASHWPPQEKISKEDGVVPLLPAVIDVRLVMWDSTYTRGYPFYFSIPLYAQHEFKVQQEVKQDTIKSEQEDKELDLHTFVFGVPKAIGKDEK